MHRPLSALIRQSALQQYGSEREGEEDRKKDLPEISHEIMPECLKYSAL